MAETCRLCQKSECETDLESMLGSTDTLHNCNENDMFSHVKTYLDCYRLVAMTEVHLNSQISNKLCNHCSKQLLNAYNFMKEAYYVEQKLLAIETKDPIEVPNNNDDLLLALRNTEFMETCGSIVNDVLLTDRHTIEEVDAGIEEAVNVDFISETVELNDHTELDECLVCYACHGLEFPNQKELRHHLLHAHMTIIENSIKKCDLCGEVCRQRTKFLAHVRTHKTLPSTFKCISCENSEFVTHQDYMQHKIEAHLLQNANVEDANYECQNCQTEFISYYNLRRHLIKYCTQPMLEHMSDVDLTDMSCKICHRKLSRLHSLLNHVKRHKQVRKTSTCDLCGKTLFLESSMLAHKRQHEQELKVFDVPKSNEDGEITTWNVEFSTTTSKSAIPELKCKICNKQFVKLINLNRHVERHEEKLAEDASGPFPCNQCEKIYTCKRALNQHLRRHFNALFNCEYCDKKFINKRELQVHTRFHTRDYPFVCEICGQRYGVQSSLNEHLMRHQGVRYKCEECGKCFKKSCSLREHSRFHTGKMPYPCVYCDRAYTTKDKYRYHLKNKHNLQLNDEECMKSRKLAQQQADAD